MGPSAATIANVEQVFRAAMRTGWKDRVMACARELGWLFSGFEPDPTLEASASGTHTLKIGGVALIDANFNELWALCGLAQRQPCGWP
jgi:hypothetical protein